MCAGSPSVRESSFLHPGVHFFNGTRHRAGDSTAKGTEVLPSQRSRASEGTGRRTGPAVE